MAENFQVSPSLKLRAFLTLRQVLRRLTNKVDLLAGPVTYNQDGLATTHAADFMRDRRFLSAYEKGEATGSWRGSQIHWRCYVCCWAALHASRLSGDFVECGVNRGGYSRALIDYVGFERLGKTLYLLDTFQGLREDQLTVEERAMGRRGGGYDECYDDVLTTFAGFPVDVIRGAIPETLARVAAEQVAYLSIDMNCVAPEVAALEFFWPKLVIGGVVVHDDYGCADFAPQKRAIDAFARERGVEVLALPTGQGLLFKS